MIQWLTERKKTYIIISTVMCKKNLFKGTQNVVHVTLVDHMTAIII